MFATWVSEWYPDAINPSNHHHKGYHWFLSFSHTSRHTISKHCWLYLKHIIQEEWCCKTLMRSCTFLHSTSQWLFIMLQEKYKALTMTVYNLVPGDFSSPTAFSFPPFFTLSTDWPSYRAQPSWKDSYLGVGTLFLVFSHVCLLKFIQVLVKMSHSQKVSLFASSSLETPFSLQVALFFIIVLFTVCSCRLPTFIYFLVYASTIIM